MNRIHQPKNAKFAKNAKPKVPHNQNIQKPVINIQNPQKRSINIINTDDLKEKDYIQFKTMIEENISYLKEQLNKTNELSLENKNGLSKALEAIYHLNEQISNYTNEAEEYKKITNERIEKLVKLFLLVNNTLSNLQK